MTKQADTSAEQEPEPPSEAEYWRNVAQKLGLDYFVLSRAAQKLIDHLPDGEYVGLGELRAVLKTEAHASSPTLKQPTLEDWRQAKDFAKGGK